MVSSSKKRQRKFKLLKQNKAFSYGLVAVVIAISASVGVYIVAHSHAATPRDPTVWPFSTYPLAVNGILYPSWNTPIGSGAQYSGAGSAITSDIQQIGYINAQNWGYPIYTASANDPTRTFNGNGAGGSQTFSVTIHVPTGVQPECGDYSGGTGCNGTNGDHHMMIIDPTHTFEDEFYQTDVFNWTASGHTRYQLDHTGFAEGSTRAYGGSAMGGAIRVGEIQNRSIKHALGLSLNFAQLKEGQVWPATSEDGFAVCPQNLCYTGSVPMGSLAAIPPTVNLAQLGLTPDGLALATAFQDYGAYVVDMGGGLYAEPSAESLPGLANMRQDLAKITPYLRAVINNTPANLTTNSGTGGGAPIVSVAPLLPSEGGSPPPPPPPPPPGQISQTNNLATGKTFTASDASVPGFQQAASNVNDKDEATRWIGSTNDNVSLSTDLGASYTLSKVSTLWAGDTTKDYQIQMSPDNVSWKTVATGVTNNTTPQLVDTASFSPAATGRYFRILTIDRWNNSFGNSIYELGIYGAAATSKLGDLNNDNKVDVADLSILLSNWGKTGSGLVGDLNNDNKIDILDLSALLSHWG